MLQHRGRVLTEALHNHNTTMIALTRSAPIQALCRSVQSLQERVQGVGQKRGLEDVGDLSESAPPAKSPKAAISRKQIDGNPDNPQECTRGGLDADSECYFSRANNPWNVNGENVRYPKPGK
jgi:hypothetical protein